MQILLLILSFRKIRIFSTGYLREVFSLPGSVFPRLRNAWPTMATLLIHASCRGNFSFQLIFLYICLTMVCVRKVVFTSKLGEKKILIKFPPKLLTKSLKMSGIQSFFEVLNGCTMYFFTHFSLWRG